MQNDSCKLIKPAFRSRIDSIESSSLDSLFVPMLHPRTTSAWNAIITTHSKSKTPTHAITAFLDLLRSGLRPDHLTFPFLLKATSRLASPTLALSLHALVLRLGLALDRFVANSLIHAYSSSSLLPSAVAVFRSIPNPNIVSFNSLLDAYSKSGDLSSARQLFDGMSLRDVVSWSALIDGYVKGKEYVEALAVFERMRGSGIKPNYVTMVSVLCACAHLGALEQGRAMHRYVEENSLGGGLNLATSLVDMYAKCGAIEEALRAFRVVLPLDTDVLIWNAIIGGFASHGFCQEALDLFEEMEAVGVKSDEITYLSLLSACAHAGRVNDAWHLFASLKGRGMMPHIEHYACFVDALGRSGRIEEALRFIRDMPVEPNASILGALLSACHTYGKVELGEEVAKKLIELEPDTDGRYVGLSNIYASARRWTDAKMARKAMEERGVKKAPGCSSVEVEGVLHGFSAHDKLHPNIKQVYVMLSLVVEQITMEPDYDCVDCVIVDL